jgi:hypothetical protein
MSLRPHEAFPREVAQLHQPAVGPLVRPVVAKEVLAVNQALLKLVMCLAVAEQLLQDGYMHRVQALALVDAPVFVTAFQQLPLPERQHAFQQLGLARFELFPGYQLHRIERALKFGDVNPNVGRGDAHPPGVGSYKWKRPAMEAFQRMKVPKALTQVLPRLSGPDIGPEGSGQYLPMMCPLSEEHRVGEEISSLAPGERLEDLVARARAKFAK